MPKKLTEGEKLAKKEALKRKRQAYTTRRRAWGAALATLEAEHVCPLDAQLKQKAAEFDSAMQARKDYDQHCQAEVEALHQKHREGRVAYDVETARLAGEYTDAVNARNAMKKNVLQRVAEQFPDLTGAASYSVAAWTPLSPEG